MSNITTPFPVSHDKKFNQFLQSGQEKAADSLHDGMPAGTAERSEALDLFIGHLRTNDDDLGERDERERESYGIGDDYGDDENSNYDDLPFDVLTKDRQLNVHCFSETSLKNWTISEGFDPNNTKPFVLKTQYFDKGGYEATITTIDMEKVVAAKNAIRHTGKREKGEQDGNNVITSIQRSKRAIRHKIKNMGCDRLLTLTRKESNPEEYRTVSGWASDWKKFNRLMRKAGVEFQYVSVLEKHKKGNYHLHAAIVGRANIKLIRKIWYSIVGHSGGKPNGQIDVSFRPGVSSHRRMAGLAKYVSKYVSKQIDQVEFNKKRYWSSKTAIPEPRRHILNSTNMMDALKEVCARLSLDFDVLSEAVNSKKIFASRDGDGRLDDSSGCIWFGFDDWMLSSPPF